MDIRSDFSAAASLPKISFFCQLVAGLSMNGAKVVPERFWSALGPRFSTQLEGEERVDEEEKEDDVHVPGWTSHGNHTRNQEHEVWQHELVKDLRECLAEGEELWVIPVEELVAMSEGDPDDFDMVSIHRLTFVGFRKDMESSLEAFLKASKRRSRPAARTGGRR